MTQARLATWPRAAGPSAIRPTRLCASRSAPGTSTATRSVPPTSLCVDPTRTASMLTATGLAASPGIPALGDERPADVRVNHSANCVAVSRSDGTPSTNAFACDGDHRLLVISEYEKAATWILQSRLP